MSLYPCLAGASYCCTAISSFSRPGHLLAVPQYHSLAGASSSPRRHLFSWPAHPHHRAALSYFGWHCHADISYFGQRILLPCRPIIFRPAHPIAAPPLPILAGTSDCLFWPAHPIAAPPYHIWLALPCRPIIFWLVHPIAVPPLPILAGASDCLFWPAHPIAAPTYYILAGASNRRTTIAYLG